MGASSSPTGLSGENAGSLSFPQHANRELCGNFHCDRDSAWTSICQDINAVEVPVDSPYLIVGEVLSACCAQTEGAIDRSILQATEPAMQKECTCLQGSTVLLGVEETLTLNPEP